MRQTLLMLAIAIAIGSPLAMAQDAGGGATPSMTSVDASQHHAAATSQDRGKPAHKPVSAIGRALAQLLQANRPAAQPTRPHTDGTTTEVVAPSDIDTVHRTQLAAQAEPGDSPGR
jgi:hypothetical protein